MSSSGPSDRVFEGVTRQVVALRERLRRGGGAWVELDAQHPLCECLEWFVPSELAVVHREWEGDSLDGFARSEARRAADDSLEFRGVAWRLGDGALLPVRVEFGVADDGDSLAWCRIRAGVAAEGAGSSRGRAQRFTRRRARSRRPADHVAPPPSSLVAERLLAGIDAIEWEHGVQWQAEG